MNTKFWRILTVFGFFLALFVVAMLLVLRFRVFESLGLYSAQKLLLETQQFVFESTQETTQEGVLISDEDRKSMERMYQGCLEGLDCIRSLDAPVFVATRKAKFMNPDDLVLGVVFDGWEQEDDYVKAYPIKILEHHELVNDFINENPVIVTYSALSMTPRVYQSLDGGASRGFGVSGMLLNGTPVLYDHPTQSLWSQFDGSALTGAKRGEKLPPYDGHVLLIPWSEWLKKYPGSLVLSDKNGNAGDYVQPAYPDYSGNTQMFFPVEHQDSRLPAKEKIYGIILDAEQKAYGEAALRKTLVQQNGQFEDVIAGRKLTLNYDGFTLTALDSKTRENVPVTISYYFVWSAFYPGTGVFEYASPADSP